MRNLWILRRGKATPYGKINPYVTLEKSSESVNKSSIFNIKIFIMIVQKDYQWSGAVGDIGGAFYAIDGAALCE